MREIEQHKPKKRNLAFLLARLAAERDARFIPQFYADISEFLADYELVPGKHSYWRLTEVVTGQINGLPGSRGFLVATDGILAYIICQDGSLYKGHFQHFVKDPLEDIGLDLSRAKPQTSQTKPKGKREYNLAIY